MSAGGGVLGGVGLRAHIRFAPVKLLRCVDDAGVPVRLAARWAVPAARAGLAELVARPGAVLRVLRWGLSGAGLLTFGTLALLTVMVVLAIKEPSTGMYLVLLSPIFTSLLGAVAVLLIRAGVQAGRLRGRMVRVALHRRCCPGCGYSLSGHAGGAELVVCPECASRWRAARLGVDADEPPQVLVVRVGGE